MGRVGWITLRAVRVNVEGRGAGGSRTLRALSKLASLDTLPRAALTALDLRARKTMLSSAALDRKDKRKLDPAKLESLIGEEVGVSDWTMLDQDKIDAFAELTFDPY